VGSGKSIAINVRLVVATHRDLPQMVKDGRFREDLYYRLNVITVKIPPLRDRREDLPALARHTLQKLMPRTGVHLDLSEKASEVLAQYDWPGNIRELENVLERASILCAGAVLEPDDLQLNLEDLNKVQTVDLTRLEGPVSVREKVQQEEQEKLKAILLQAKGNVAEASRIMGVARTTLIHRLKKYGLI
jgi:two-component system response regulator HydG